MRTALTVLAGVLSAAAVVCPASPVEAAPGVGDQCYSIDDPAQEQEQPPEGPHAPFDALRVAEAQELVQRRTGQVAGTGVTVAVIDSGVLNANIPSAPPQPTPPLHYHGTAMAGIIAGGEIVEEREGAYTGPVGIAPAAGILDLRVYDKELGDDGEGVALSADGIIAGLEAVKPYVDDGLVQIVNVSLSVDRSTDELRAAVEAITDAGAVVVASSGNADGAETDDDEASSAPATPSSIEDYAAAKYPAGYAVDNPLVVAAGTLPAEGGGLPSSAIDLVVPTFGAISYAINQTPCAFGLPSTSVAAAEVSGILALLMTAFPKDNARQVVARLEATATGGDKAAAAGPDRSVGYGAVQLVEALNRPLDIGREGVVNGGPPQRRPAQPAVLPPDPPDVLESTRTNAVWWGLLGGGALVVALLLRPVMVRRRPSGR